MPEENFETRVKNFCKVCDHYKSTGPCFVGYDDQRRYVHRNWCGWASIEGHSAAVTLQAVQIGLTGLVFPRADEEAFREAFRAEKEKSKR